MFFVFFFVILRVLDFEYLEVQQFLLHSYQIMLNDAVYVIIISKILNIGRGPVAVMVVVLLWFRHVCWYHGKSQRNAADAVPIAIMDS